MKVLSAFVAATAALLLSLSAAPLHVLIPSGESAAEGRFAGDLAALLESGQVEVEKAVGLPTEEQFAKADVLVLFAEALRPRWEGARAGLEKFAARGGGFVVVHGGVAAGSASWWKPLIGGAWVEGVSQKFDSKMMLYVATDQHPIVRGASAFDLQDETLYDLETEPEIQVLASAFTPKVTNVGEKRREKALKNANAAKANVYDLQPQLWAYEAKTHRAVVALQGAPESLAHSSMRTFLLRGVAWAGHRENLDEFTTPEAVAALRYPAGGPETPEATAQQMRHHPDFTVGVAAAEPLINKPIAIQWDERGRLWVAETPEYPNGRRPPVAEPWKETGLLDPEHLDRPARDRISYLSEPDANGRFTKKTVFYEGLELVTGFCLYKDGVIALHEPDISFIHGEGKEQKVERLYAGFKPGDTHFVGNHLIVAADGWIYADMGGSANVTTPDGSRDLANITSGMFRFRPDGSAIEQVSSKGGNGFGAEVTSDGELFFGQATSGNPIQHVALPEQTLALGKVGSEGGAQSVIQGRKVVREALPDRVPLMQIDMVGGYSAACSSMVYEGGAWPAEWDRGLFCTEPILNIIHHEALRPAGATFTGEMVRLEAEFIYSPDYWFRPIDVSFGPDGALYILDFYNPVIAHSDSRGPLHSRAGASIRPDREHYFGRIYRVQHTQAKALAVPDLSAMGTEGLAGALAHPNRIVRANALRLLMDRGGPAEAEALRPLAGAGASVPTRILALWGLQRLGKLPVETLKAALRDGDPASRKTGGLIAEAMGGSGVSAELTAGLNDADPRARIAMLRGLAATPLDAASAAALVAVFPKLSDDLTKSAAVAAAASSPVAVIGAALRSTEPAAVRDLVSNVAARMVEKNDAEGFASLVALLPAARPETRELKLLTLRAAARVKPAGRLEPKLLGQLIEEPDQAVVTAALPLAVVVNTGALTSQLEKIVARLLVELSDSKLPEARRADVVAGLVGAHAVSPEVWPAIGRVLAAPGSEALKRQTVDALRATDDSAAGVLVAQAFESLPPALQQPAFDLLLTREAWVEALLGAIEAQKIRLADLGPANVFRLRSHPDKALAQRASEVLNKFGQPNTDKDKLIAQLTPIVTQPGNAAHGKELFIQACAICHKLGELGKEVGPVLTGIGAHGPAELLISIVDPSRQIDAGFELINVETTDGQTQSGIVAQENDARVVLRSPAGDVEVPKSKIKSMVNTHRSLMPEGFEGLGGESLRDILAFICGGEARYRILDLSQAFSADTRRGLYNSAEAVHDTLDFKKFGIATVEGIPFNVVNPENSLLGGNVIVLRGGGRETFAHTMPKRVEVKVGLPVKAFDFLGGVAGWGTRKPDPRGRPAMRVVVHFQDGAEEETVLHDGVEFVDYAGRLEVPGSRLAEELTAHNQVRWFSIPVQHAGTVEKLILESYDNGPAATTVAITADLGAPHP